jgi:carboxyl-terminal processing protease
MTRAKQFVAACSALALVACGGGGNGGGGGGGPIGGGNGPTPTPAATPTPTAGCSLATRKAWVLDQLDEWYLFPELFNAAANPNTGTVQDYIDALVAPARAQSKDRYFTYITSIAEENAYYNSGAFAGFGFRLGYDTGAGRVFVIETFEGTPALGANIDRGTELLAISGSSVAALMQAGGPQAVIDALGPDTVGTSRTLRVRDLSGVEREVTLAKTEFELDPVSNRYGAKIINDGGRKIGYINLRTFIGPAEGDLRDAFASFKTQGVTQLIVDLRYNGGGLVSIAELFAELMLSNHVGDVLSYTTFRTSKSSSNETARVGAQSQAFAPQKVAFIGTGGTASASELVINAMIPYLGGNMALIGSNTYGKPVGQIALDNAPCDDRLRAIAFKTENANHQGEYFTGLAGIVPNSCRANDDISHQLGDPAEQMVARSLDFLAGRACTPISATSKAPAAVPDRGVLRPERGGDTIRRELPGAY